ncbi:Uncharacterised protein [Mycobacteroides abscessus]|nr:Uncharacterised protein [Mycobacteroides abscessus]
MGEARVDLDRDAPVDAVGGVVDGAQEVGGGAHVVRRDALDGGLHGRVVGARGREVGELGVVGVALRERRREDRGVRGHADDAARRHQLGEVAGAQPFSGEVVEPDRHARSRELLDGAGDGGGLRHRTSSRGALAAGVRPGRRS